MLPWFANLKYSANGKFCMVVVSVYSLMIRNNILLLSACVAL